jgi:hypothetical protein
LSNPAKNPGWQIALTFWFFCVKAKERRELIDIATFHQGKSRTEIKRLTFCFFAACAHLAEVSKQKNGENVV